MLARPAAAAATITVAGSSTSSDGAYFTRVVSGGEVSYQVVTAPVGPSSPRCPRRALPCTSAAWPTASAARPTTSASVAATRSSSCTELGRRREDRCDARQLPPEDSGGTADAGRSGPDRPDAHRAPDGVEGRRLRHVRRSIGAFAASTSSSRAGAIGGARVGGVLAGEIEARGQPSVGVALRSSPQPRSERRPSARSPPSLSVWRTEPDPATLHATTGRGDVYLPGQMRRPHSVRRRGAYRACYLCRCRVRFRVCGAGGEPGLRALGAQLESSRVVHVNANVVSGGAPRRRRSSCRSTDTPDKEREAVVDALKTGGYASFLTTLRKTPVAEHVTMKDKSWPIRWARQQAPKGSRHRGGDRPTGVLRRRRQRRRQAARGLRRGAAAARGRSERL